MDIEENIMLAPLTTIGVGGPARFFASVARVSELEEVIRFAAARSVPVFILVGGSNVVISDRGFPGLVIRMDMKGIEVFFDGEYVDVRVGAGESWDNFVEYCVTRGWSGLECLSGIPGSVGAAPVQNIGAYGVNVASALRDVEVFDRQAQTLRTLLPEQCAFDYRDSIFKHPEGAHFIITHVTFRLNRSSVVMVPAYHDLQEFFREQQEVTLTDLRSAIIEIRSRKGMVILPGYETYKSAGSFFKNPVVNAGDFVHVESAIIDYPDGACTPPWHWAQQNGQVKIAAACLMEAAGFPKGYSEGRVGLSPKHALSIINLGGATAAEVVGLAQKIQDTVREKFGVQLEHEAQYVGFDL